ncbi:hypothetical protein [Dactylosporangium sp. NPDC000521]|uniref:hypothetical protein n=1 Tax=Dactylosporangium sp. NPDC000521 TaxID=3363975 RepID=UPI0036808D34
MTIDRTRRYERGTQVWFGGQGQRWAAMRVFAPADPAEVAGYVVRRQREAVRESVSAAVRAVLPCRRIQRDHPGPARETPFARHGAGRSGHAGGRRQVWGPARRRSPACVNGSGARGR